MNIEFIAKVFSILEPALKRGMAFLVSNTSVDLDTGMKSGCILVEIDGEIIAQCRYKKTFVINNFDDVLNAVKWCECGKGFGDYNWLELIDEGEVK